jgi:glutamyl/glutaminyl-tRNA synthetase
MGNGIPSGEGATPNPGTGATPNPATGATPEAITLEQALAELASVKHAHQNAIEERDRHRASLSKFEKAQAEAEQAKLSDIEKAAKRAEAAEAQAKQYQQQLQTTQVKLAAQSLGFNNPEMAARLITLGDEATPEAITKALSDLLKSDPYLASSSTGVPSSGGNPTNPQRGNNPNQPVFRTSEVAQWSVDDFAKNQDAYARAVREGRVIEDR